MDIEKIVCGIYYQQGYFQNAIAKIMRISDDKVRRYLNELRDAGYLNETLDASAEELAEAAAYLRDFELEEKFRDRLSECLGRAREDLPNVAITRRDSEDRARRFKKLIAVARMQILNYLRQRPAAILGVSWGRILASIADEFERSVKPLRLAESRVISLFGDITPAAEHPDDIPKAFKTTLSSWSSILANRFASALGTKKIFTFHMYGWIPLDKDATPKTVWTKQGAVQDVLRMYPGGYSEIFGGPSNDNAGLARNADVILSGIGSRESYQALLEATGRWDHPIVQDIQDELVGDFSGAPLNAHGVWDAVGAELLEKSMVGAGRETFLDVSRAAADSGGEKLGVIAISFGPEKAAAALALFKWHTTWKHKDTNLINELWCDPSMADAILALAEKEGPAGGVQSTLAAQPRAVTQPAPAVDVRPQAQPASGTAAQKPRSPRSKSVPAVAKRKKAEKKKSPKRKGKDPKKRRR